MTAISAQLVFNIFTLAIIAFSVNLSVIRSVERQAYLPLAICLAAIGVVISQPTVNAVFPALQIYVLVFSLPAMLLIAPAFWFYVCGITATSPWHWRQVRKRHFIPSALGLMVSFTALLVPTEAQYQLLVLGNENVIKSLSIPMRATVVTLLITTLLLVVTWILQSGFYFYQTVQRLARYRQHLKHLFATTDRKEIRWLSWLLLAIGLVWCATAINIVLDNFVFATKVNANIANAVILIMVWSVALWGLRQKPGLEELYTSLDDVKQLIESSENSPTGKYQRSALSKEQAASIAQKIEAAMQNDNLYLDAALSLQKLASHISTSPNYISQTLNESLGATFFDYVNRYRIEAAKQELAKKQRYCG